MNTEITEELKEKIIRIVDEIVDRKLKEYRQKTTYKREYTRIKIN